jgi:hypothetical protein
VPSVLHSVKRLVTESRTLPSAALGKAIFAECGSGQSHLCRVPEKRHSAKRPALGKGSDSGSERFLTLGWSAHGGGRGQMARRAPPEMVILHLRQQSAVRQREELVL